MDVPNLLLKDENAGLETANISVAFKYLCSKNYYGPNCNHYCDPRHSVMTHYRCHPQTGAIVCQPGWKGTNCNQGKCLDGWTGLRCDQCVPIAGCLNGKCHYNPILSKWEPYTCECDPSWMGMLCNINKNICTSSENPCQNGGECVETTDLEGQTPLYACHCRKGFTGTHCEQQVHDCHYHGCGQKGECQNDGNCSCVDGYFGSMCQFNYTSCAESPCLGVQSTCHMASTIKQTEHGLAFQCLCEPGRYGLNCEFWTNLCSTGIRCLNGGRCVSWSGGYRCICPPKFIGPRCELPRTACRNDSCANGGECLDRGISFTCQCPLGWTGATCHENVNECAEIPRWTGEAVCKNGAGCRDLLGSYQCLCTIGWTGRHCEIANKENHTDEKIICSNSSHCREQPEFTTEPSNVRILTGNQTKVPPDEQSIRQFFILFTIMGVTIPLALITLIAGVISLVSNCRSYRKDRTTRWVHYEQASRNKAKPTDYTTKQYLQVSDCQPKRVAENNSPGTPMYPNQFPTTKLTTGWSETQMEREKTLPNFLEDQSEVKRYDDKQTAQNEEQKLRESTPLLVHLSSSLGDTEPPRCPCNCVQNVSSLQTTAMSQLPYIDQTVINTLNLLSSSRASSPPPPYEESERNWDHVIASHSTS
ncbi:Delta protein [Fasciolopsis buskii]|uniref:Delta-like protein n=1 Tax=Fasciolopsis buskii TaxID=27845 RepID=A0A8E0S139_9TREM|nr:Delta protein [Fasciolopsis buski]